MRIREITGRKIGRVNPLAVCARPALAVALATVVGLASGTRTEAVVPAELAARGELPNFVNQSADASDPATTIVYLGGSITEAYNGYRDQSLAWIQSYFTNSNISGINAGIGGTNSVYGAYRTHRDVLMQQPDLVFIEFAVNDGNLPGYLATRAMEGIVRQIRNHDSRTDICFVYTMNESMYTLESQGQVPTSIAAMEQVAAHYGIPTINMAYVAAEQLLAGDMLMKGSSPYSGGKPVFTIDGVHPHAQTGHAIYADAIGRSLTTMTTNGDAPHAIPTALDPLNYEHATMTDLRPAMLTGSWQPLDHATDPVASLFSEQRAPKYKAAPGDTLTFTFTGRSVGFEHVTGPDVGSLEIKIDGNVVLTPVLFDSYSTYYRISSVMIDNLTDGEHLIEVAVLPDAIDKAGILAQRGLTIDNPDRYDGLYWYVGNIMVNGTLVPEPASVGPLALGAIALRRRRRH